MAKGYWVTFYRSISDTDALAAYSKLATQAIANGGGKFLARGLPTKVFELGINNRMVVIEFESIQKALATFEGAEYQTAAKILDGKVERDVRLIEGV